MGVVIAGDRMSALKPHRKFVTVRFANIGDLDEILQLGSSRWHSIFCKSQLLASSDI